MPEATNRFPTSAPPPVDKPEEEKDEIIEQRSLRDYYIILRERLWIALPLALSIALGLGYWQSRETPQYSSTASIQYSKPPTVVIVTPLEQTSNPTEVEINTDIKIFGSRKIQDLVVAALKANPEAQKDVLQPYMDGLPPGAPLPSVEGALGSLSVQPLHANYIVEVSVAHRSPKAAMILANLYVEQFMAYLKNKANSKGDQAAENLMQQAQELQKKASDSAAAAEDFIENKHIPSLEEENNVITPRFIADDAALRKATEDRKALEAQLAQVELYQSSNRDPFDIVQITFIANYGNVSSLRKTRDDLLREQSVLLDKYLELHPLVLRNQTELVAVEKQLTDAIMLAIADLKTNLEKSRATEARAQEERDSAEKALNDLQKISVQYQSLIYKRDADQKNYQAVLDRQRQVLLANGVGDADALPLSILDKAQLNTNPISPNHSKILRTSVGVFVIVFLGIAVGLSYLDDRIKSTWDVETFINVTLLGIIPDLGSLKDEDRYRLVLGDSQGAGVEPFLGLYSSVKIHSKLDFPKSLLVTSTVPGEGKTLISCNLAGSFARHGKKTLLIDCDLRRPMLHRHFNVPNEQGLISWYENGATMDGDPTAQPHLGITSLGDNLSLITSGGRTKSPTQFLESPAFARLVEYLKKYYDLIIIDSPPVGAVTDALLIAERADEVVYVCRFNRAYRKHIRLYIKALRSGKNEVLGIVLNGLSPRRIEYYSNYRYYRSYKKYYGVQS